MYLHWFVRKARALILLMLPFTALLLLMSIVSIGTALEDSSASADTPPASTASDDPVRPQEPFHRPQLNGSVEATGTSFQVTGSQYLDVAINTDEPVAVRIDSFPSMVTYDIEALGEAATTSLTIAGLEANTTYYKYEDDYHNLVAFSTDADGRYTCLQDLSSKHHVMIQEHPSTVFLTESGWVKEGVNLNYPNPGYIGEWDPATKTGKLLRDVGETIQIDTDGITLDGNRAAGVKLSSAITWVSNGVYANNKTNVTVKNLRVEGFWCGVALVSCGSSTVESCESTNAGAGGVSIQGGSANVVRGNVVSGVSLSGTKAALVEHNITNSRKGGISLTSAENCTLRGNRMNDSNCGFFFYDDRGNLGNTVDKSNLVNGRPIFWLDRVTTPTLIDAGSNAAAVFLFYCRNITVKDLALEKNSYGFYAYGSSKCVVENVSASGNSIAGIYLRNSSENTITGCAMTSNGVGLSTGGPGLGMAYQANYNTIIDNVMDSNERGMSIFSSHGNTFRRNLMNNNAYNFAYTFTWGFVDDDLDTSNLTDGKPIYWIQNQRDKVYDPICLPNPGAIYFVDCSNITVRDFDLNTRNDVGLHLFRARDSRVENVRVTNCANPITLTLCSHNTLVGNEVTATAGSAAIFNECSNHSYIMGNAAASGYSYTNTILLRGWPNAYPSSYNRVYRNVSTSGDRHFAATYGTQNVFSRPLPIGGNHVSNWTSPDVDADGIVDSPFVFTGGQDDLPWVQPNGWPDDMEYSPPSTTGQVSGVEGLGGWYTGEVSVGLSGTDNPAGWGLDITEYSYDGVNWTVSDGLPFAVSTEGSRTLHYRSIDWAGNIEPAKTKAIRIDKTAPSTTAKVTGSSAGAGAYYPDVTVELSAADKHPDARVVTSGILSTEYSYDAIEWHAYSSPIVISVLGTTTVDFRSTDRAGNVETGKSVTVVVVPRDGVAPTTSVQVTSGITGLDGWYLTDVTLLLVATDDPDGTGVKETQFALDDDGWGTGTSLSVGIEGVHTLKYYSVDNANNIEETKSVEIKIDKTAPSISGSPDRAPNPGGWYNSDVTVTFAAADAVSGLAGCTAPTTIASEGKDQVVSGTATDAAGNSASCEVTGISIDKTPPASVLTVGEPKWVVTGPDGVEVVFITPQTPFTLTATDPAAEGVDSSGVQQCEYKLGDGEWQVVTGPFTLSVTRPTQLSYRAIDVAGNIEEARSITVVGDLTLPQTTVSVEGTAGNNGWHTSDVTLTASAEDTGSGVARTEYHTGDGNWRACPAAGVSPATEGAHRLYFRSTDNVGNVEEPVPVDVKIDKTAPAIVCNTPCDGASYLLNSVVLADWYVADSLSGVETSAATVGCGLPIDTATRGEHTFTVSARDMAGNARNLSVGYKAVYEWSQTGSVLPAGKSIFKQGSTVPIRFQLLDANGTLVTDAVVHLYVAQVSGDVTGDYEMASASDAATEGNLCRFADGQYTFNLSTKNMGPGTWMLTFVLDDGTEHTEQISLK